MMESKRDKIMEYLKETKLGAFRRVYDEVLNRCVKAKKSPEEFLLELLEQEIASRRLSALKVRIKTAKFPQAKDLDTFDFKESGVDEVMIRNLYEGSFLKDKKSSEAGLKYLILGVPSKVHSLNFVHFLSQTTSSFVILVQNFSGSFIDS